MGGATETSNSSPNTKKNLFTYKIILSRMQVPNLTNSLKLLHFRNILFENLVFLMCDFAFNYR